jgi:hypothetical protein
MKIFTAGVNYSLHLNYRFQPYISGQCVVAGPHTNIHTSVASGYAGWVNIPLALIDNKLDIESSGSVAISTQRVGKKWKPRFIKVLHVNEKNFPDEDKDLLVYMDFIEHHGTQNYPQYFPDSAVISMLGIRNEDIITLEYEGDEGYIHSIVFVMRDGHRTGGILGTTVFIFNESGQLRTGG